MKRTRGKMTFSSLLGVAIVLCLLIMGIKFIGSEIEKRKINNEVKNVMGIFRDNKYVTTGELRDAISDVLRKNNVAEKSIKLSTEGGFLRFQVVYVKETDYVFFKKTETVKFLDQWQRE